MSAELLVVKFTPLQLAIGSVMATERLVNAWFSGARNRTFEPDEGRDTQWENAIAGVLGEWTVVILTGLPWTAMAGRGARADVGEDIEVRTTRHAHGGLTVHEYQRDAADYVLVTYERNVYTVRGFCPGVFAKSDCYHRPDWGQGKSHRVFCVPQEDLLKGLPVRDGRSVWTEGAAW